MTPVGHFDSWVCIPDRYGSRSGLRLLHRQMIWYTEQDKQSVFFASPSDVPCWTLDSGLPDCLSCW